ncbi:MAG TPA: APC family permease [Acetobacteraceae bacterium]|nr:APC family permease [Acetobacteraceae bacterium]
MSVLTVLLGRRLSNREVGSAKITEVEGVPAMGLDALSSAAYGPEAALTVLLPLGAAGLSLMLPIMATILVLLAILFFSYWQTIEAYPTNGGSYTVASENLGRSAGLLAGTALMVDYILNVAVGISAGVAALTSAIPALHPWTLPLCLGVLALITLVNLRGTQEAGLAWSLPTYLFVVCWVALLIFGLVNTAAGNPGPVVKPPPIPPARQAVDYWLVLRAFAAGCTAMTGVEAVSNSVNAFRSPSVSHARRTLTGIVVLLAFLLLAIALLAHGFTIGAMDQSKPGYQSVLSQLTAALIGRGPVYDVAIGSVLAVLCLSANTSFVGFPRVCRLLASDEYLPHYFAMPGRRLVYSLGILFLGAAAGILLIAFGGITDKLIPLFAVGAFLSFTLSQAGMAMHWTRELRQRPSSRVQAKRFINGLGAVATGIALVIIVVAKFVEGAWITILVIPLLFSIMQRVRRRYATVKRQLHHGPMHRLRQLSQPAVMLPMENWNAITAKALHFAMRLSQDVLVVHLSALEGPDAEENDAQLHRDWHRNVVAPAEQAGVPAPQLMVLRSEYRQFLEPLQRIVHQLEDGFPERPIAVLIPEVVKVKWWDYLLYTYRARQLQAALMRDAGPRLVVIDVPWRITEE